MCLFFISKSEPLLAWASNKILYHLLGLSVPIACLACELANSRELCILVHREFLDLKDAHRMSYSFPPEIIVFL